jgi:hypothetical protein
MEHRTVLRYPAGKFCFLREGERWASRKVPEGTRDESALSLSGHTLWDRSLDRARIYPGMYLALQNTRLNSGSCPRNSRTLTFSGVGYPHERRKERKKGLPLVSMGGPVDRRTISFLRHFFSRRPTATVSGYLSRQILQLHPQELYPPQA